MRQLQYSKTDHKDRNTITGSSIVNSTRVTPFITFSTKIAADVVALSLTQIFAASIKTGIFPRDGGAGLRVGGA